MAKKELARSIKNLYQLQDKITPIEIEENSNFIQIIMPKRNPGIALAKRNKVVYTVAKGDDIINIDPTSSTVSERVVGRISRPDVKVTKSSTYKLVK